MVGLADIPCVGKFVERISEDTVDAVFRGLRYMFCYKALVDQLNSETEKLNIEKDKVSRKVKAEEGNGKIIEADVLKWQKDAEEIHKTAKEFSPSCTCIQSLPIPNPISRFRLGRNAAKKAQTVTKLTISGKAYLGGEIAHLPLVLNMPKSGTTFEEFQSRKDAYRKLWDALVTEDSPLIHGIYGMPGVGKTRMMEKIWEDAMKKKIFDKVVRVNVGSGKLNEIKLQDQIADRLGCKLEFQDVERRASQLENCLRNADKILLILDDVWQEICLENIIGTSFGDGSSSKGSKILLTSREKDACLDNKCEHPVEIKTLSHDEALYLFKNTVGPNKINSLQDESLVQKVCDECGQLPLLIYAVGKALKGKPHNSWEDAHDQLKKGRFEKIPGVAPQVYAGIQLSIDNLKDDDARSCLFLCSFFPEDADIDMNMLIELATGSELVPDGELRVLAMVHYLKISSLLLDSGKNNKTKVHDIIRDVARSIAFTDSKYAFLQVTCNSRYLPSDANYCTRKFLRLDAETDDVHFNEDLVFPDLQTLWLQSNDHSQQFSGGFFSIFVNIRFLMLENVNISLEKFSLKPLSNLRTLILLKCDIRKTDVSLFPRNLETLWICYNCKLPRPLDVANLKYLRKLKIQQTHELVMVSNVISSLSSLEELHIQNGFIIDGEENHTEARVREISKLTHLTSLKFHFCYEYDDTFQGRNVLSNIDRYNIYVGEAGEFDLWDSDSRVPLTRSIEVYGNDWQPWEGLIARAEVVRLGYSNVEVSSICNDHERAFEDLKRLYLGYCANMKHLASTSQDEIQHSHQQATSFSKLTTLKIFCCSELKYLFCNNIAKSLVQLQWLSVESCASMESIIMNNGTGDEEILNFSKLKSLKISNMLNLASFYAKNKNLDSVDHSANASARFQPLFDGMVAFPFLEELEISSLPYTSVIWGKNCYNDNLSSFCKLDHLRVSCCKKLIILIPQTMLHRLKNLEYIYLYHCSSLRTMLPPSAANDLKHLKEISVNDCTEMTEIIEAGEQVITDDGILFPELTVLKLFDLKSLTDFWCYQSGKANTCTVLLRLPQLSSIVLEKLPDLKRLFHGANFEFHLPALNEVKIDTCGLSTLFTFSMFRNFQLEKLKVRNCELLRNVVEDLRGDETCDKIITLSQLTVVRFEILPNLRSSFHNANYEFHMPAIKKVKVVDCGLFSTLFRISVLRNLKQLQKLKVSDCGLLEGIFEDVRGDETSDIGDRIITLSRLSSLFVKDLPKLKSFFHSANYECNMPALKKVIVHNCGLSTLFTCSVFRELQQLKELKVCDCRFWEHIVKNVKGDESSDTNGLLFPELTSIMLFDLPSLTSFWCNESGKTNTCKVPLRFPRLGSIVLEDLPDLKSFFHGAKFEFHVPALKEVKVDTCGLSTLFTFSMFKKFQLENLEVRICEFLESIVKDLRGDETCDKITTLSQLTAVVLAKLPNLKSFFHNANYELHMPVIKKVTILDCGLCNTLFTRSVFKNLKQLEELRVSDCELLESIFEDARADETLDTSDKIITLDQLSTVRLQGLPKFKSIFYSATYQCYMPALNNVKINGCGLFVLFTCSVFRELQQLEELHVYNCESLEHIVEEVGSDETSEINGKTIKSPKLSSITLESLPNLRSFSCSSSYVFSIPKLQKFRLIKCPQIEYFSSSKTNTSVVRVTSDWHSEVRTPDLNDYIRQNHKEELLGTQSERTEEEKPRETEIDQPDNSV